MSRNILLIIGGGIAAYKSLDLIRRLRERDLAVRVVMTAAAAQFVTPLAAASLSGDKVYQELFSLTDEAEMGHIELSRAADLIIIAPATADLLAKAAHGLANDLASTLLLATDTKILAAPAMNLRMWLHPATQRNIAQLRRDGMAFVGPDDGAMACGEFGPGRMAEPLAIVDAALAALAGETKMALVPRTGPLAGRHVLITSGPTHEPMDPVRYIANRSSGRQGHALAAAAVAAGARVTLISGPVQLPDPHGVTVYHVETAREMLAAVQQALPVDIFIGAAAVADWRVAKAGDQKIKKPPGTGTPRQMQVELVENPDILASVATGDKRPRLVVGFAAETENVIAHAQAKLARKGCDLIIANDVTVSSAGGVMGGADNTVHVVSHEGVESWPKLPKEEVAQRLMRRFATMLDAMSPHAP
ncbi:MAG: bifunctional phosphopantothenoylcysteine decarboxylase/phosphopantothenate--cysteine ligase CoaBC [Hyphomicrobiales bacterium]|nr:bifunctional phosphopantothenoylcysteine decarboxylase/phosphopantothenate--cysteine ligase CoaBC [Hyphomicrobiales bacterium]